MCSHIKRERRINKLLLGQIQMNSDDKWNPQIPDFKYIVNFQQKEGKVWQTLVLTNTAFVETLVLREYLRTLPWIHTSSSSGSSSYVGNPLRNSSRLHAADNPSRNSGSLLRRITSESARNTSVKMCSVKLSPVFSAANEGVVERNRILKSTPACCCKTSPTQP